MSNDKEFVIFFKNYVNNNSWKKFFLTEWKKDYFKLLLRKVSVEYKKNICYPEQSKIFRAFQLTDFDKLKVIILGQDPYHNNSFQADGLAFSVPQWVEKPPSLRNIIKEVENNFKLKIRKDFCDLSPWAYEGVFLLNTYLTVQQKKPLSHENLGWGIFTENFLKYVNKNKESIVFMLWGVKAKFKAAFLDNKKHYLLFSSHPSPLSASGFFNNKHFLKANNYLSEKLKGKVNWVLI